MRVNMCVRVGVCLCARVFVCLCAREHYMCIVRTDVYLCAYVKVYIVNNTSQIKVKIQIKSFEQHYYFSLKIRVMLTPIFNLAFFKPPNISILVHVSI